MAVVVVRLCARARACMCVCVCACVLACVCARARDAAPGVFVGSRAVFPAEAHGAFTITRLIVSPQVEAYALTPVVYVRRHAITVVGGSQGPVESVAQQSFRCRYVEGRLPGVVFSIFVVRAACSLLRVPVCACTDVRAAD